MRNRNNESAKVIQNCVDQLITAKKDVVEGIQQYTNHFNSSNAMESDSTYIEAAEMFECATNQEIASLRIIRKQEEKDCLEKQVLNRAPKKQFMKWNGSPADYGIYRSQMEEV